MTTVADDNTPYKRLIELPIGSVPAAVAGAQNVFVDSDDHHLKRKDESDAVVDLESGGGTIENSSAFLTADVALVTGSAWYDGPGLSLAAGTWLILAGLSILTGAAPCVFNTRIWDGTNVFADQNGWTGASTFGQLTCSALAVLTETTTVKVSANCNQSNYATIKATAVMDGATNKASWIIAVRLA